MLTEILRIYENIEVLLQKGTFPGEMAPAIVEALNFMANAKAEVAKHIEKEAADGKGDRSSEDQSGLAGSDVPDKRRKSRKGRKE